jgi:phosphoenolpyruvate carboxykinase (ATP)
MHCSANVGKDGDTAIFFGLSGTGKTTLSADPERSLIGDDEHGWTENTIFNFEGGCYAKTVNLSEESEPDIWNAIKFGAIEENSRFYPNTRRVNYSDTRVTENTRVSYPINYIKNTIYPSIAGIPKNIFFLAADAFGVLPPISKLTPGQAMYHFISGYTAKVAGTEIEIVEPKSTFSACFGAAFLPLHPTRYAEMLGEKMKKHNVNVWLVNTGWIGGKYGVGKRIDLRYTRAMISAALMGKLDYVDYHTGSMLGTQIPTSCPDVPAEILRPKNNWSDVNEFYNTANKLVDEFIQNFEKYKDFASKEILEAAPRKHEA